MLVKFGVKGSKIQEFYLEDNATIQDLLEVAGHTEYDEDDIILHQGESVDIGSDMYIEDGHIYILDTVTLSNREAAIISKILDFHDEYGINDLSKADEKKLAQEIIELVQDYDN